MGLFIGVLLAIPLGLIPAFIAKQKGHSFGLWWLYGWALFIVAIIHVMFIEDRTAIQKSNFNNLNSTYPTPVQHTSSTQPISAKIKTSQAENASLGNTVDDLRKLNELLNDGILTQEEFDTKKKQILGL